MPLTRLRATVVAFGVDDPDCRPGPSTKFLPDGHIGIVDDRMFDFVPHNRLADVLGLLLVRELR